MFDLLFTRKKAARKAAEWLYDACIHQARLPVFYETLGIPDTITGRFDLLSLHVALIILVLQQRADASSAALAQAVFDVFFLDMDRSARERGVGDLAVPHHIKRMMAAFNGRLHAYRDDERVAALARNVYGTQESVDPAHLRALADYTLAAEAVLKDYPFATATAAPVFPAPATPHSGTPDRGKRDAHAA